MTTQRERYPSGDGQSRVAAYPALAASGRPDDPTQEEQRWAERRVWTWLSEQVLVRRVDKVGRLSLANRPLANRPLAVGRAWARQEVTVRLALAEDAPVWVIADAQGQPLRQHPAPELSRERIRALDVSHRRVRPRRGQPRVHHQVNPYTR